MPKSPNAVMSSESTFKLIKQLVSNLDQLSREVRDLKHEIMDLQDMINECCEEEVYEAV